MQQIYRNDTIFNRLNQPVIVLLTALTKCIHCSIMSDKKPSHLKHLKQQYHNRQLIQIVIDLINANDHDSLAYIARYNGIPPQLRYLVWPILLKYHPFCISPNIISNTVVWNQNLNNYQMIENNKDSNNEVIPLIIHDLKKYFHIRGDFVINDDNCTSDVLNDYEIIEFLKNSILSFLNKWSKVFKYEPGLVWIAIGLAEWFPICYIDNEPLVLIAKKHSQENKDNFNSINNNLTYLFKQYPLPNRLKSQVPTTKSLFTFDQLYERLLLVILHCPDIAKATMQTENYFPFLTGGDLQFQSQLFFKVFQFTLPELYQPLIDETNSLQPSSQRINWLYWWLNYSGAYVLTRQDRARVWDILLGWRMKPNMDTINFFLNYNVKKFDHLYNGHLNQNYKNFLMNVVGNDTFWFPDLNDIKMGSTNLKTDFDIFQELLKRNRDDEDDDKSDSNSDYLPLSLVDPHVQLIFIYIAILQLNESKLLEFEESEISEFLNNVPIISKINDNSFRKMQDFSKLSESEEDLNESSSSSSGSSMSQLNNHMIIEVGSDGKQSHSFNDILDMAGDIWRKWVWSELEDSSINDAFTE